MTETIESWNNTILYRLLLKYIWKGRHFSTRPYNSSCHIQNNCSQSHTRDWRANPLIHPMCTFVLPIWLLYQHKCTVGVGDCSLHSCAQAKDGVMDHITQTAMGLLNTNGFCFMKTSQPITKLLQPTGYRLKPQNLCHVVTLAVFPFNYQANFK